MIADKFYRSLFCVFVQQNNESRWKVKQNALLQPLKYTHVC